MFHLFHNKPIDKPVDDKEEIFEDLYKFTNEKLLPICSIKEQPRLIGNSLSESQKKIRKTEEGSDRFYARLMDVASLLKNEIKKMSNEQFITFVQQSKADKHPFNYAELRKFPLVHLIVILKISSQSDISKDDIFASITKNSDDVYKAYQELNKISKANSVCQLS